MIKLQNCLTWIITATLALILLGCTTPKTINRIPEGYPIPLDSEVYYETSDPIRVYRGWNSEKEWSKRGRWWSTQPPSGTLSEYRRSMAVCPEWSPLDTFSTAVIRRRTALIIGYTSAVQCDSIEYGDTSVIQIYLINPSRLRKVRPLDFNWKDHPRR